MIALVIIYFGKQPDFLRLFLNSARCQKNIDFLFFTDWEDLPIEAENLFLHKLSFDEFNRIAIAREIIKNNVPYSYKLCDIKPAWTDILREYLPESKYDYVGYCDIDLVLGDVHNFFDKAIQKGYDLCTITTEYLSGALTIYKNNEMMRRLYRQANGWDFIFNDSRHYAFDEALRITDVPEFSDGQLQSFSDAVFEINSRGGIKVLNDNYVGYESRPGLVCWDNGKVYSGDKEYIFFHYVGAKQCPFWTIPDWNEIPSKFYVNKYGFYREGSSPVKASDLLFRGYMRRQVLAACKKKWHTAWRLIKRLDVGKIVSVIRKYF